MLVIHSSKIDVLPYLDEVIAASNSERNSFGFLPKAAYREFADREQLIIALDENTKSFVGYTIFAGALPAAKVRQTYVHPDWRGKGVGKKLISELVKQCEQRTYLSIRATVAADLTGSNGFYESLGFFEVARKSGGKSKNRSLVVRVRELETPSLLNFVRHSNAGQPEIYLDIPIAGPAPLYLFDLNVIFDVIRRRHNNEALSVFAASFENSVRLAISEEFVAELERTSEQHPNDPLLQLARGLPVVKKPSVYPSGLIDKLAELIFPDRYKKSSLSSQDRADLYHLATAIIENTAGFITSEKAILRQSAEMRSRFGIDVVSPNVFASADSELSPITPSSIDVSFDRRTLTSRHMTVEDEIAARALMNTHDIAPAIVKAALSQGTSRTPRSRVVVRDGSELIAFATWQISSNSGAARVYLFGNYADDSIELAIDHLIDFACRSVSEKAPAIITLSLGDRDVAIKERVIKAGFSRQESSQRLAQKFQKVCLGRAVTAADWPEIAKTLNDKFGLLLPSTVPTFGELEAKVSLSTAKGGRAQIKLKALEDFLAPTVFALPDRPAVIVPIWPSFVEALFRGSGQPDFLAGQRAQIVTDKCYLLKRSGISRIPDNGLIAFYESRGRSKASGRSAAIAIARIQRRYLASEEAALKLTQLRGVLSVTEIKKMAVGKELCVVEFDNLMLFKVPIGLAELKKIGCADDANLVTARTLSNSAITKLIELGKPYAAANV